jgi:hypothetical protein
MTTRPATPPKPSTPLPWKTLADNVISVNDEEVVICDCMGALEPRMLNSAYITHAANSYPRLVEALRSLIGPKGGEYLDFKKAEILLRELGEIE